MTSTIERQGTREHGRFVLRVDEREVGELTFVADGPTSVVADHTFVQPALRGQGHARALVDALVAWARAEQLKIVPTCWYVRDVLTSEPELVPLIAR